MGFRAQYFESAAAMELFEFQVCMCGRVCACP
jgi:hypothetical protein